MNSAAAFSARATLPHPLCKEQTSESKTVHCPWLPGHCHRALPRPVWAAAARFRRDEPLGGLPGHAGRVEWECGPAT